MNVGVKEFREKSYPESKKITNDKLFFTFIFRRVSVYFSYLAVKTGIPANLITGLGISAYIIGCYFLAKGTDYYFILGAAVVNMGMFLDLIDGVVARFNGPTKLGGFLELQHSYLINALLLPSLAVGLYYSSGRESIAVLLVSFAGAMSLSLFNTYFEIIKRHFQTEDDIFSQSKSKIGGIIACQFNYSQGVSKTGRFLYLARMNLLTTSGIMLPLLLICAVTGTLLAYVLFYSIVFILQYLGTALLTLIMFSIKNVRLEQP